MAILIEDGCVGCPPEIGCLGNGCPRKNIIVAECDECGDPYDTDSLYVYEDEPVPKILCSYCLCQKFQTVEKYGVEKLI